MARLDDYNVEKTCNNHKAGRILFPPRPKASTVLDDGTNTCALTRMKYKLNRQQRGKCVSEAEAIYRRPFLCSIEESNKQSGGNLYLIPSFTVRLPLASVPSDSRSFSRSLFTLKWWRSFFSRSAVFHGHILDGDARLQLPHSVVFSSDNLISDDVVWMLDAQWSGVMFMLCLKRA